MVHTLIKVNILEISQLYRVAYILNACGKDMVQKYNLHHWDNPFIKSFVIVILCALKNHVYLLQNSEDIAVATFMTRKQGNALHFEKLATLPFESGKGIGSLCLKEIEKLAKAYNCNRVIMEVYELSQHAISFYNNKGYRTVGTKETLKYKELKMEKSI